MLMILKQFVFAVFLAAMVVCCDSDGRARDEHFTATPEENGDKTTKDNEDADSGAPDTENEKDTGLKTEVVHPLKNLHIVDDLGSIQRPIMNKIDDVFEVEHVCQKSGGLWLSNLYSCTCDQNMLFSAQYGCTPIEVSTPGMNCLKEGMVKLLEDKGREGVGLCLSTMFPEGSYLRFADIDTFSDKGLKRLAIALDREGFGFLKNEDDLKDSAFHDQNAAESDWSRLIIYESATRLHNDSQFNTITQHPFRSDVPSKKSAFMGGDDGFVNYATCTENLSKAFKYIDDDQLRIACGAIGFSLNKISTEKIDFS